MKNVWRRVGKASFSTAHDRIADVFDQAYYLRSNPDLSDVEDLLFHYLNHGWLEGRDPCALFDSAFYLSENPDVLASGQNPLLHYVTVGFQEFRSPHPLFSVTDYFADCSDVRDSGAEPLGHYLNQGWREKRPTHPLFDTDWYALQYMGGAPTVAPLADYAEFGFSELRDPHPLFDAAWYREVNAEVRLLNLHPLVHYYSKGVTEDRAPHRIFDIAFYREQLPELIETGQNPLVHFLREGAFIGASPNREFDSAWYLEQNQDVRSANANPLVHYLLQGWREGRDPSPTFSTNRYLAAYPDAAALEICPLVHYFQSGIFEGKDPSPVLALPEPEPVHVPLSIKPPLGDRIARLLAFYLPQFHAIPENNEWWGEGFTEWTNVRRGMPQYEGHYQPRVPGELDYYDLGQAPWSMKRQADLARNYGLEGFCFYFYWFAGKTLLENPIKYFAEEGDIDFPFCLCWANENWSRRWDGLDSEILIAQKHSPEDDIAFIEYVSRYMKNQKYIRVNDRPLLLVYRPLLLPNPAETAERWRQWCRNEGIGEIYLVSTQSFDRIDPVRINFDAAVEFPPNNSGVPELSGKPIGLSEAFEGKLYDWKALARNSEAYEPRPYKLFRGVNPSWDNTARRKNNGTILYGSSPEEYGNWLARAVMDTRDHFDNSEERFVFINAWNEWAEGACLEPDANYGYAWLDETYEALRNAKIKKVK